MEDEGYGMRNEMLYKNSKLTEDVVAAQKRRNEILQAQYCMCLFRCTVYKNDKEVCTLLAFK